jgi:hypothetical protein
MLEFDIPKNLNGAELRIELADEGIQVLDTFDNVVGITVADGKLWLNIDKDNFEKAKIIVDNHNGTTIAPELTVTEKLASVGLNVDELKVALGL